MQSLEEPLLWVSVQSWSRIPANPGNSSHSKSFPELCFTKHWQNRNCTSCIC